MIENNLNAQEARSIQLCTILIQTSEQFGKISLSNNSCSKESLQERMWKAVWSNICIFVLFAEHIHKPIVQFLCVDQAWVIRFQRDKAWVLRNWPPDLSAQCRWSIFSLRPSFHTFTNDLRNVLQLECCFIA